MTVHEIKDNHSSQLFCNIHKQADTALEEAIGTGLPRNIKPVRLELNAPVFKAVGDMIWNKQADSPIQRVTPRTLKSE